MSSKRFQFKLFMSDNPQAQYDALETKDECTFYLLKNGTGYFGDILLFSNDKNKVDIISDMLAEGFIPSNETVPSTLAIMNYIANKISTLNVVTTAFFRQVTSHTLTQEDLNNTIISKPEGVKVGDVGLLFTADTDGEEGGESYIFISLMDYLSAYHFNDSNSITFTTNENNQITADIKVKADETSLTVGPEGVYIKKTDIINDGDNTEENGPAPSSDTLVTEAALVDYIQNAVIPAVNSAVTEALKQVVIYTEDNGQTE